MIRLSERFPLCGNFLLAEIPSLRDFLYFLQSLLSPHRQLLRDPIEKKLGMGIRPGTNFCQSNEVARLSRLFPFPLRRNYRLMYNEIHPAAPIKLE